jgi:hypothetical protein
LRFLIIFLALVCLFLKSQTKKLNTKHLILFIRVKSHQDWNLQVYAKNTGYDQLQDYCKIYFSSCT